MMSNKYAFGWSKEDAVEVPELDALLEGIKGVCKKYGVGFELESDYDGGYDFNIVPFERAEWDFFTKDLDDYSGGIPFLDQAKKRYEKIREDRRAKKENAEKAKNLAAAQARKEQIELELKLSGIVLSDGHYKLVKRRRN